MIKIAVTLTVVAALAAPSKCDAQSHSQPNNLPDGRVVSVTHTGARDSPYYRVCVKSYDSGETKCQDNFQKSEVSSCKRGDRWPNCRKEY